VPQCLITKEALIVVSRDVAPIMEAAALSRDTAAVESAAARLRALLDELEAMMHAGGVSSDSLEGTWIRASAFELYSACCSCWELMHAWAVEESSSGGAQSPRRGRSVVRRHGEALRALLRIASKAATNSDLHLSLAATSLSLARDLSRPKPHGMATRAGKGTPGLGSSSGEESNAVHFARTLRLGRAERAVIRVLQARYGCIERKETLDHLLQAAEEVSAEIRV